MSCNLASHCAKTHCTSLVGVDKLRSAEEVRRTFKFTLIESLGQDCELDLLKQREEVWRTRLESWVPVGLNVKDD